MQRQAYSVFLLTALVCCLIAAAAPAQDNPAEKTQGKKPVIDWTEGPAMAKLGDVAEIKVPEGFLFTDAKGAQKLLELTQNIPNGSEIGAIVPAAEKASWFITFEFSDTGYIKDDEKDTLDAGAILKSMQDATERANEIRKQKGWTPYHVISWEKSPFYDPKTNNMTWAARGRDDTGSESINYSVRVLGRRGTIDVDLVISPEDLQGVVPAFNTLIAGLAYTPGNRYADFVSGDKVASYGLTALVAGGVGAAMVKSGLLQKFWKLIVLLLIGAAAAIKKAVSALFGRKEQQQPQTQGSITPE